MTCNDFSHKQEARTLKKKIQTVETYRNLYYCSYISDLWETEIQTQLE